MRGSRIIYMNQILVYLLTPKLNILTSDTRPLNALLCPGSPRFQNPEGPGIPLQLGVHLILSTNALWHALCPGWVVGSL